MWRDIDANVGGLVAHGDLLVSAGLGASRGLLVAGPPGVGNTALCRVIAGELPPGTTKLIVDSGGNPRGLALVYVSLARLVPAAVFLDDLDVLAGDRRSGTPGTVATTNDTNAIDPALTRLVDSTPLSRSTCPTGTRGNGYCDGHRRADRRRPA